MDLLLSVTGAIRPHLRAMDNHASDIRSVSAVDIRSEERNEGRVRIVDIACRSGILVTNHTPACAALSKNGHGCSGLDTGRCVNRREPATTD
jgi:hypothetical protein